MKWKDVNSEKPKPYQLIKAKGTWRCGKVLYLDDENEGWEQKYKGHIEVTHWKPMKNEK